MAHTNNDSGLIGTKLSPQGTPIGPVLLGSLFIPSDKGLVFEDGNGGFWKTQLVLNGDGTATLNLVPVTF